MQFKWLTDIGECLGVEFSERQPGKFSAQIRNPELGVRARVEIIPGADVVRVFLDRDRAAKPTFIARLELKHMESYGCDTERREVTFADGNKISLVVSANATAQMYYGEHPAPELPVEKKVELVEITGVIGRPEYKRVKDGTLPIFTAGLGVKNGDEQTHWLNLLAYRAVADKAHEIGRGKTVKVTGSFKEESWADQTTGEIRSKQVLVATAIEAA